jgi:hypothetical protein
MDQKKLKHIALRVKEVGMTFYSTAGAVPDLEGLTDLRQFPFITKEQRRDINSLPADWVDIVVDKKFAPDEFFRRAEAGFNRRAPDGFYMPSNEYLAMLNNWMAIVDHFGVDADYTQEFFDQVNDSLIDIMVYGYVCEGDEIATASRYFNGRTMIYEDFCTEFTRLLMRYIPKQVVPAYLAY